MPADDFKAADILFYDTLLMYNLSIDPQIYPDEVWVTYISNLLKIKELEAKATKDG